MAKRDQCRAPCQVEIEDKRIACLHTFDIEEAQLELVREGFCGLVSHPSLDALQVSVTALLKLGLEVGLRQLRARLDRNQASTL